jgi:hypothetical protein
MVYIDADSGKINLCYIDDMTFADRRVFQESEM